MPADSPFFSVSDLDIDVVASTDAIVGAIRSQVTRVLGRRGVVVGLSGGVDSSVTAALLVRALGPRRVFGLMMPEAESSDDSLALGHLVAQHLGIESAVEEITAALEAVGCYRRRDESIKKVVPDYGPGYKCKIVLPDLLAEQTGTFRLFSVVVRAPDGSESRTRLTPEAYFGVVAATNFKHRVRKMMEYHHADRLNYAVAGTPNRLEYDQGFFVKAGDGAADLKPIAHLYKSQVYQLGRYLEVPDEILKRSPTTDTYSLPQSQDEFYFSLPYDKMDLCLLGKNRGLTATEVAEAINLTPEQVERVFGHIDAKRNATRYQHAPSLLVEAVPEI